MVLRSLCALFLCGAAFAAKPGKFIGEGASANADLDIKATIYADGDSVQQALGSTLDGHYIVVQLHLTPKAKYAVDFDNFMLRTDKDGERSHPFKPTQIAGDGALVVNDGSQGDGKPGRKRPTFSGMGGGMGAGTSSGSIGNQTATMQEATGRRNPLLNSLFDKMLPEEEGDKPVSGLLYFPMEKQKLKDLELIVTTASGKLSLRFK